MLPRRGNKENRVSAGEPPPQISTKNTKSTRNQKHFNGVSFNVKFMLIESVDEVGN